jgi:hypothetical protein
MEQDHRQKERNGSGGRSSGSPRQSRRKADVSKYKKNDKDQYPRDRGDRRVRDRKERHRRPSSPEDRHRRLDSRHPDSSRRRNDGRDHRRREDSRSRRRSGKRRHSSDSESQERRKSRERDRPRADKDRKDENSRYRNNTSYSGQIGVTKIKRAVSDSKSSESRRQDSRGSSGSLGRKKTDAMLEKYLEKKEKKELKEGKKTEPNDLRKMEKSAEVMKQEALKEVENAAQKAGKEAPETRCIQDRVKTIRGGSNQNGSQNDGVAEIEVSGNVEKKIYKNFEVWSYREDPKIVVPDVRKKKSLREILERNREEEGEVTPEARAERPALTIKERITKRSDCVIYAGEAESRDILSRIIKKR